MTLLNLLSFIRAEAYLDSSPTASYDDLVKPDKPFPDHPKFKDRHGDLLMVDYQEIETIAIWHGLNKGHFYYYTETFIEVGNNEEQLVWTKYFSVPYTETNTYWLYKTTTQRAVLQRWNWQLVVGFTCVTLLAVVTLCLQMFTDLDPSNCCFLFVSLAPVHVHRHRKHHHNYRGTTRNAPTTTTATGNPSNSGQGRSKANQSFDTNEEIPISTVVTSPYSEVQIPIATTPMTPPPPPAVPSMAPPGAPSMAPPGAPSMAAQDPASDW